MIEPRFTKGPWEVATYTDEDECLDICCDLKHIDIVGGAKLQANWLANIDLCNMSGDFEEMEANAHLMAAAPEMYALLDEIRERLYECAEGNMVLDWLRKVDYLLKKARGE